MSANLRTAHFARVLLLATLAVAITAVSAAALEIRTMPFTVNDVVYDKIGGKLYVSVPGSSTAYPNTIVVINPSTGAVEASVWVGSDPNVLALSADGQYLYVGLGGAAAVRRVYLPTLTPGLQFGLGSDPSYGPYLAGSIAVMPGAPGTIAVARIRTGITGTGGVAIYDDGIQRPAAVGEIYGPTSLAFDDDGVRLFGSSSDTVWELAVSAGGVAIAAEIDVDNGCSGRLRAAAGRLVCGGLFMDTDPLALQGRLPGTVRTTDLEPAGGLALSAGAPRSGWVGSYLIAWDLATLRPRWWIALPTSSGVYYRTSIAAFPGGAAVHTGTGQLSLVDTRNAHPLVLSRAGSGQGTATAQAAAMTCGSDCARLLAANLPVTLTATASTGSRFVGWEGDADCVDGSVVMDGPRTCVARFERLTSGRGLLVPLPSNDIVYSPATGLLYASVPSSDVLRGNTITAIDPSTGELGASIWVGSEPGPLALSDDGVTLYAGLSGSGGVQRVDLASQRADGGFAVGWDKWGWLLYAEDLAVLPGDPSSVAVVRRHVRSSGGDGVAVHTNGVLRPRKTDGMYDSRSLAFSGSPSRLYGYDNYTSAYAFSRFDIGTDGVTLVDSTDRLLSGYYANIHFDGGRIYSDSGQAIDPERLELLGTFPLSDLTWSRAVVPDLASNVVYAAGSTSSNLMVRKYDPSLFTLRQSVSVQLDMDLFGRLRLAGPNRVAVPVSASVGDADAVLIFAFDQPVTHLVAISSSGALATVPVDVSPADASGLASGVAPFDRRFADGTTVTVTAPAALGSKFFYRWQGAPSDSSNPRALTLTLSRGYDLVAQYRDPAPTVTSVTPSSGPTSGGMLVTITGTGFQPGAVPKLANYYPLTDVAVVSATTITARTPAVGVGTYPLYVTNPDNQYGILASAFRFANLPGYFVKSGPSHATSGTPGVIVLTWSAAPNASRYEYCLDSTVNGSCDGAWVSAPAATRAFVGPLTALVTYEWQARAVSAAGTTDADGGWWTFTVAADPGCAPGTRAVPAKPATTQGLAGMWQPTGLSAVAGRPLSFFVGPGQTWMNGTAAWSAAGNAADPAPGNNVPLTGAPRMALVGRVGVSGAPFVVGGGYQALAAQSGEVFLAPNDDWYALHDNAGSLAVTVCPGETPCTLDGTASVPATAAPGESAVFKASVTSTGCLNALTYAWDFGDGTPASAEQEPSHAYAVAGTFAWSVTIRSGSQQLVMTGSVMVMEPGSCVPATKSVQAKPAAGGLAGMWQATGVMVRAGDTVTLGAGAGQQWSNGSASWTASGNAADVAQGPNCPLAGAPRMALVGRIGTSGAPFLVGQQRQLTAPTAGEIYLAPNDEWYMVWDNAGALSVSICAGGSACSVDATGTIPPTGSAGAAVAFSATATATGCAGSPTYEWDFGDGSAPSTEQNPSHNYAAGTYTWTLTVRAGAATATRTGSIAVSAGGGCIPVNRTISGKPAGGGLAAMWQATGVTVRAGESLSLSAGSQTWSSVGRPWTGAGDASDLVYGQNCPLPGAPRMALVGRIGAAGAPFLVGVQTELTAAQAGELYLAPNDDWYLIWDNAGTLSVSVCRGAAVCTVQAGATAPATAIAGEPVAFAGTASATACAAAPVFEWDFGDGSPVDVEAGPTHNYAAAGTYTWTLIVRADAASITRSGTIVIREPGSCSIETRTVLGKPTGSGLAGMWQATGITVAAGDILAFDAAGGQTWITGGRAFTADGNSADVLQGQNCPLPGGGRMALVGRIGTSGAPFFIGQHRQITALAAGQLYLAPNDDWYLLWDNAGTLAVSVCR